MFESGEDEGKASEILTKVPELMQRIVGKSIPLEVRPPLRLPLLIHRAKSSRAILIRSLDCNLQKFVARRARKYIEQDQRLVCPGIELAYVLNCLGMSPRYVLFGTHLDQISDVLADLHDVKDPKDWSPKGVVNVYWDGQSPSSFSDTLYPVH